MLKQHKIDVPDDSMRIRRAIRARLGSGGFTGHEGWTIHRSDASREITEAAEDLAAKEGSRLVFATHLLKALFAAPDKAMGAVLEEQGVILGWIDVGSDDTSHSGL